MPTLKRQRLSDDTGDADHDEKSVSGDDSEISSLEGSLDTSDEIAETRTKKSRQTSKRKIRATGPSNFGATLQSLLKTDAPSAAPLSLKPSLSRKRKDEKLELRAKKVLQVERKQKEDVGRIRDVIGGWGGESERTLRKVAQRGGASFDIYIALELTLHKKVVKLFNAIQQSQATSSAAAEEAKAARGSGKPTLPAPVLSDKSKGKAKGKVKDNLIGRGKQSRWSP